MPRRGKKRIFRGIPSQKKRENTDTTASTSSSTNTDSTVNIGDLSDPNSVVISVTNQDDSMQSESLTDSSENVESETDSYKTASERKLGHLSVEHDEEAGCSRDLAYDKGRRTGYRLIDLECLNDALKVAHRCKGG